MGGEVNTTMYQWALDNAQDADIDASEAWELYSPIADVVAAVIDTGIDYSHPSLAPNMWVNSGEVPGDGIDNDGNGYVDDIYGAGLRWA